MVFMAFRNTANVFHEYLFVYVYELRIIALFKYFKRIRHHEVSCENLLDEIHKLSESFHVYSSSLILVTLINP